MRSVWRRLKQNWNHTDTLVVAGNVLALGIFIGNCWWMSVTATYVGAVVPLAFQSARAAYKAGALRTALIFGGLVGFIWPGGEWIVVHTVGWWGAYVKPDILLLDTPLYAVFVAWVTSTYCVYVGLRVREAGGSAGASSFLSALSAFSIGALGENLFVWSAHWRYDSADLHIGAVPAFIPVSYGLCYAIGPYLSQLPFGIGPGVFSLAMLVASVGLGLACGFFPR